MPKYQNDLKWDNVHINALGDDARAAAELFYESKQGLEQAMLAEAIERGLAHDGDGVKISTTKYPVIGVAVVEGKGAKGTNSAWAPLPTSKPIKAAGH